MIKSKRTDTLFVMPFGCFWGGEEDLPPLAWLGQARAREIPLHPALAPTCPDTATVCYCTGDYQNRLRLHVASANQSVDKACKDYWASELSTGCANTGLTRQGTYVFQQFQYILWMRGEGGSCISPIQLLQAPHRCYLQVIKFCISLARKSPGGGRWIGTWCRGDPTTNFRSLFLHMF